MMTGSFETVQADKINRTNKTKLDHYMPKYDYVERHKIVVKSSPEKVFKVARNLDLSDSQMIALLFGVRNAYGRVFSFLKPGRNDIATISLKPSFTELLEKTGFIYLDEIVDREIVLGLIGKFWMPTGHLVKGLNTESYESFEEAGYAKTCMNFLISENSNDSLLLTTETRIQCLGAKAETAFTLYWAFVRPFSGLTRHAMLNAIKRQAES